jgi:ribosome-associated heat shock protein Hsp15
VVTELDTTRVDRWLCAVRLHSTRTAASEACMGGHVRINDKPAKPSSTVRKGDSVRTRSGPRERIVEVVKVIDKRVGAAVAVDCYIDNSPVYEPEEYLPPLFARDRGAGRPTKKDRRDMDKLRG